MKKSGLNMSGFKKIHEDDKSAIMQHPQGHKIMVAKSSLSPDLRKTLSELPLHAAEGTMDPVPDPTAGLTSQTQPAASPAPPQAPVIVNVNNGPNSSPAPQTSPAPFQMSPLQKAYNSFAAPGSEEQIGQNGESPKKINPQAYLFAQKQLEAQQANQIAQEKAQQEQRQQSQAMHEGLGLSQPQPQPGLATGLATGLSQGISDPGPSSLSQPNSPQMGGQLPQMGWVDQAINAENKFANVAQGEAQQQSKIFGDEAQSQQKLVQEAQTHFQNLQGEYDNMVSDIQKNHINPNHYVENQTVPQRVSTAIGLILGGIGGGITGQENPAMKFLQSQIDRDVSAQEKKFQSQHNLLGANQSMMANSRQTMDMFRLMKLAGYEAQIKQSAAKMGGAQAQLNAQKAIMGIRQSMLPLMMGMTAENVLANNPDSNARSQMLAYLDQTQPERAKALRERLVPSMTGIADRPVPQEMLEKITARQNLDHQITDLEQWTKQHSGSLNPAIVREGETKAALLQDAYRMASGAGVFKPAEMEFVNGIVHSDPTAFFSSYRTLPGYRELGRNNRMALNTMLQGVGFKSSSPMQNAAMRPGQSGAQYQPASFRPVK